MKVDRRTFTKSLAAAAGMLALPSWSTKAEAARLPVNRVTKIRIFYPPNYQANGPQAFPQSNMIVLVDTEAGITGIGQGGSPDTVRNMARSVMDQIVKHGHVQRARIGVSIKDLAVAATAETVEGALIADVSRGSPAEQVGIQKGDIIVAAGGAPIRSAAQLRNKISLTPVGERLQLRLRRRGALSDVSVEVAPATEATGKVYSSRQQ